MKTTTALRDHHAADCQKDQQQRSQRVAGRSSHQVRQRYEARNLETLVHGIKGHLHVARRRAPSKIETNERLLNDGDMRTTDPIHSR